MQTLPINRTDTFMKNIEEAIQEHGTIACPNPMCFDKLVSKKKWDSTFGKTIEYGCQNPECVYHAKRHIHLNSDKVDIIDNNILTSSKKPYNKILAFSGLALFVMLAYTSFYLYDLNRYMENEIQNIEQWKTNYEENRGSIPTVEKIKSFVETFDVNGHYKNVFLGKAYLNLPNFLEEKISLEERKQMQLISLKHYLLAAKNNQLGDYEKSAINAINEISKAYRLFKFNPNKPSRFQTIEKLIQKNDTAAIQNRVNFLDKILQ